MPRKRNHLNIKSHLEHANIILDGLAKYGMCPILEDELKKFAFLNRAILQKHAAKGTRKDLYLER